MDNVNLQNKRVLVTGGNGYLGKKLIQQLIVLNAKVFCFDIHDNCYTDGIEYAKVDLGNSNLLREVIKNFKPNFIYHLAALLDRTRNFEITQRIFNVNVNGTINLLNALDKIDYENFIYTSTSEIYGGKHIKPPFREDDNFIPASPYSLSKYTAEMTIKTFSELRDRNYSILRLFNIYGGNMPADFFIPQLIEKLRTNEDFEMTKGEQLRDFIHIDDTVSAMLLCTSPKAFKEVFNVCSGQAKSIQDVALDLKEKMKSKSDILFGALPYRVNEVWDMVGDNSKICNLLKFKIKHNCL